LGSVSRREAPIRVRVRVRFLLIRGTGGAERRNREGTAN